MIAYVLIHEREKLKWTSIYIRNKTYLNKVGMSWTRDEVIEFIKPTKIYISLNNQEQMQ